MTNLQDLERRLRERHDYLYKGSCIPSCITEAADLIATLRKIGEGLPEPKRIPSHGYQTVAAYTREQMIQAIAQGIRKRDEEFRALKGKV